MPGCGAWDSGWTYSAAGARWWDHGGTDESRSPVKGVLIVSLAGNGRDQSVDPFRHEHSSEIRLTRGERGIIAADDLDLNLGEELLAACIAEQSDALAPRIDSPRTSILSGVTRTIPEA